ncbi:hypothetical protein ABVK25_005509 [Lepraria finkii]|uniref:Uncharacterized protein n=1 Tax=Lepraria finkii TaxID=1340010 RepID=A0ABR4BEQ5_9LECA
MQCSLLTPSSHLSLSEDPRDLSVRQDRGICCEPQARRFQHTAHLPLAIVCAVSLLVVQLTDGLGLLWQSNPSCVRPELQPGQRMPGHGAKRRVWTNQTYSCGMPSQDLLVGTRDGRSQRLLSQQSLHAAEQTHLSLPPPR